LGTIETSGVGDMEGEEGEEPAMEEGANNKAKEKE